MTRILPRRGAAVAWAAANPILWMGERGYETDSNRWKTGDGETPWNALPYDLGSDAVGDLVEAYLDAHPADATDLTVSRTGTSVTVASSTGADAVVSAADNSNAGVMTAAMQTKLAGVASGATANSTDAVLKDRSNHTGTQLSTTISDFAEAVQDTVGALLVAGTNVTLTYNDVANTLTISASGSGGGLDAEAVRDTIGAALLGTGNITVTVDDAGDTITISTTATVNSTDAALRDRSTHTGTQLASTISDFSTAADARIAAAPTTGAGSLVRAASPTFTGTVSGISKSMVGLGNVDNTADTAKPVSTAQQAALDLKAPLASPTFTGTVSGITKSMVGLGSVDNTADTAKAVLSASKLTTARNINGVSFDGSANVVLAPQTVSVTNTAAPSIAMTGPRAVLNDTALAAAVTGVTVTGAADGYSLLLRFKDAGTSQSIALGSGFRAMGVNLPTATTVGKWVTFGCIYNGIDSIFDVVAVSVQA